MAGLKKWYDLLKARVKYLEIKLLQAEKRANASEAEKVALQEKLKKMRRAKAMKAMKAKKK